MNAGRRDTHLTSIPGIPHTLVNHPACETPGLQFRAGSGFTPRQDSLELSRHTSRLSCQPSTIIWSHLKVLMVLFKCRNVVKTGRWKHQLLVQIFVHDEVNKSQLEETFVAILSHISVARWRCLKAALLLAQSDLRNMETQLLIYSISALGFI